MAKAYKKQPLGRGLSALLSDQIESIESANDKNADQIIGNIIKIPLDQIKINPFQPRTNFENEKILELANSIRELGIIQPITVRKKGSKSYEVISGERRLRAVQFLKIKDIPAYVRIANDQQSLEMALVENIQRENLDPIEIALCYQRLIDEVMLTQDEMSKRVGKKRSTIANYIRLLKLDPIIQSGIRDKFISMGHGRAILSLKKDEDQLKLYKKILKNSLSVRAVEILAKKQGKTNLDLKKSKRKLSKNLNDELVELRKVFNSKVNIRLKEENNGTILFPFANITEFKTLMNKLNAKK